MRGARNSPRRAWALPASALALVLLASAACDPKPAANAADATTPAAPAAPADSAASAGAGEQSATPASAAPEVEPWRYGPALTAAIPAGVHAEPVAELADGVRGRARIVVAVASGDRQARLEVWDFSQNNERGLLARVGEPELLLDLGDVRGRLVTGAVATLRRDMASPGSQTVYPVGLPGSPEEVLAELARLAAASTAAPDAATRARSLARFIRGIDGSLLWDQGRLPELLRRLQSGPWTIEAQSQLGARRSISATEAGRPVQLLLARSHGRWVLFTVTDGPPAAVTSGQSAAAAPAAEPSPTAP